MSLISIERKDQPERKSNIPSPEMVPDVSLLDDKSPQYKTVNVLMPGIDAIGVLPIPEIQRIQLEHSQIVANLEKNRSPQAIHEATLKPVGLDELVQLIDRTRNFWERTLSPTIILPYIPADSAHADLLGIPESEEIGKLIALQEGWHQQLEQLQLLIDTSERLQDGSSKTFFDQSGAEVTLAEILKNEFELMHDQASEALSRYFDALSDRDPITNQVIDSTVSLAIAEATFKNGISALNFDAIADPRTYFKIVGHPNKLTLAQQVNLLRQNANNVELQGICLAAMIELQLRCASQFDSTPPQDVKKHGAIKRIDIPIPIHINDPKIKAILEVPELRQGLPYLAHFFDTKSSNLADPARKRGLFR